MPSSYTTSLRLTLPATGELGGQWGNTVNTGITELLDSAVAGTAAVTMTDADYTLTTANGSSDQSRAMFVTLSGTLSQARNVVCPTNSKLYFVTNSTTGGYAITFKTSAGTGISVPNGRRMVLYCDGTNVVDAVTNFSSLKINNIDAVNLSDTQTLSNKTINASAFNGSIGATTPSTGAFTNFSASGTFALTGDQVQVSEGGTGASTPTNAKINLEVITSTTGSARLPSGTTGQRDGVPSAGFIRFNTSTVKFEGYTGSAWTSVGGGATGGGPDAIFVENGQTVTTNYTITTSNNAMSTGPITINSGITVTVPSGSRWVVL